MFPSRNSLLGCLAGIVLLALVPLMLDQYLVTLLIFIGIYGIAALGLNVLVGFSGQISLGHSAFFGLGAFASAWLNNESGIPVLVAMPLAGLLTTAVGMFFGLPAARIKGLYLAIATLAAQFILEDFFNRATWFTGGSSGTPAAAASFGGWSFDSDIKYFYLVLFWVLVSYVAVANLVRTRDGRAFVAVRDQYLAAEIMGINLTRYRLLAFGVSSFFAGLAGALFAHWLGFVSAEGFTILLSVQFLGMIIIGGLGSVMGTLMGVAFLVLLPEFMEAGVSWLDGTTWLGSGEIRSGLPYIKEMAVGAAIIVFLIFEPEGLAHRWKMIKAYWKLYPFSH
jgi:branched-chain amino acid transport system permease protein